MVMGGCFPVRGSERMTWKYDDDKSAGVDYSRNREACVLFEYTLYGEERGRWRGAVMDLKYGRI